MRNYPYFELDEGDYTAKLSLIPPFTINDRLIVESRIETDIVTWNKVIYIKNDNNQYFKYHYLNNTYMSTKINSGLRRLANETNLHLEFSFSYEEITAMFEGIDVANNWDKYILGLNYQNHYFRYNHTSVFVRRLVDQGRADLYVNEIRGERPLFPFNNNREATFTADNANINLGAFFGTNSSSLDNKTIHPYNYTPEYIKHYCDREDKITTLLLGAEIEVDEGGEKEEVAKEILEIIHDGEYKEDRMFAVHDGSLNRGIEFVTMPGSLEWHKSLKYKEMFKRLDELGYKAHDSEKCGLHIHINRDFFNEDLKQKEKVEFPCTRKINGHSFGIDDNVVIDTIRIYKSDELGNPLGELSSEEYNVYENEIKISNSVVSNNFIISYIEKRDAFVLYTSASDVPDAYAYECIRKLIYIVERFDNEFSAISRRNCHYSKLIGYSGEKCKELYDKINIESKYNAVNLLHKDTIELRMFKSTLKYETFINTLEFVSKLAYFVKDHTEEEVENMTWENLFETFSDELKEYYLERKRIEEEKATKKKEEKNKQRENINRSQEIYLTSSTSSSFNPTGTLYFENGSSINVSNFTLEEAPVESRRSQRADAVFGIGHMCDWNITDEFTIDRQRAEEYDRLMRSSLNNPVFGNVVIDSISCGDEALYSSTPTYTEEEQEKRMLKKSIRDLTKVIKYSNNHMQKIEASQQRDILKKELKKLKRQKRNNTENTN